jgi:hypothetical protein
VIPTSPTVPLHGPYFHSIRNGAGDPDEPLAHIQVAPPKCRDLAGPQPAREAEHEGHDVLGCELSEGCAELLQLLTRPE